MYLLTPNIAKGQYKMYTIDKKYNMTVSIDIIDRLVWDVVVEHVKNNNDDPDIIKRLEEESYVALRKVQQSLRNVKELEKQIDRINERIIEGKLSEIKGDKMINERKEEIKENRTAFDKNNYIYGQKQSMIHEGTYKTDISKTEDIEEKQRIIRRYVNSILLEKTGEKRGHYYVDIKMTDNTLYQYTMWSSGPWNKIEKRKTAYSHEPAV